MQGFQTTHALPVTHSYCQVIYKIDIPANRYDMLCLEGIARALNIFRGRQAPPQYRLADMAGEEQYRRRGSTPASRAFQPPCCRKTGEQVMYRIVSQPGPPCPNVHALCCLSASQRAASAPKIRARLCFTLSAC